MAEFNFMNYGQAAQAGQNIKASRTANQLGTMQLEEEKRMLKNREEARRIREQMDNMPAAIEEMEGKGLFDEAQKARENYVSQKMGSVRMIQGMRDAINEDNYKQVRQDLIQSGAADPEFMPVEYSDDWFRKKLEEEKGKLETFTVRSADQGNVFAQDFIQQDGHVIWEGERYEAASDKNARSGGSGSGGYKGMAASDSNSIRNGVAGLYGGMWDPVTQKYIGIDRGVEKKIAGISAEAARIYDANKGRVPHDQAVMRAAQKMNIEIPDLQNDPQNEDPLGLSNILNPSPALIPPHMQMNKAR